MNIDELKYPVGRYQKPDAITDDLIQNYTSEIATFPERLRAEVQQLSDQQLDTPYRPEGWTIRQVVNHCADSHMNALIRVKLALTEENPTIKPYHEDRWAELPDSKTMPIEPALQMLAGLHAHWAFLLRGLTQPEMKRTFVHPEHNRQLSIAETISLYAWHCRHHLAHITTIKKAKGW